jgi:hypothetical protein
MSLPLALQTKSCASLFTPVIFSIIAGFLAGQNAFGSLASMCLVNHSMKDIVRPVLYATVVLDQHIFEEEGGERLERLLADNAQNFKLTKSVAPPCARRPTHVSAIRFLFIARPFTPNLDRLQYINEHWPNLQVHVQWDNKTPSRYSHNVHLTVHKPILSSTLQQLLTSLKIRNSVKPDATVNVDRIENVDTIFVMSQGSIVPSRGKRRLLFHNSNASSVAILIEGSEESPETLQSLSEVVMWMQDRAAPLKGGDSVIVRGEAPVKLSLVGVSEQQLLPFVKEVSSGRLLLLSFTKLTKGTHSRSVTSQREDDIEASPLTLIWFRVQP